jgi:hypothetical protein
MKETKCEVIRRELDELMLDDECSVQATQHLQEVAVRAVSFNRNRPGSDRWSVVWARSRRPLISTFVCERVWRMSRPCQGFI